MSTSVGAAGCPASESGRATTFLGMVALRQAWLLAVNDLRQEARDLELILTSSFFSLVVLIMLGMSFSALGVSSQPLAVPGMLWLSVAFVGALTLGRIFTREREFDTLRALLVAPVERVSIYLAKAFVTLVILLGCSLITVLGLTLLFPAAQPFADRPVATAALVLMGCTAYAGVGTLFAAGLASSSGKNVLLSVILYPLTMPSLLFALVATRSLLEGHESFSTYLGQLTATNILAFVVGAWLFEPVLVGVPQKRRGTARAARRRR